MVAVRLKSLSMSDQLRMKMDSEEMTRRIVDVTLEIIYLLTGEDYGPLKMSTQRPTAVPPPHSESPHKKKILDLTNKIIELLTGEVPVRCEDVAVYLSVEEWEYLEAHKDLYEDPIMETQQRLPSPDGVRKRKTLERCPSPDCPQESTEESDSAPQDHEDGNFNIIKVEPEEMEVWGDEPDEEETTTYICPDAVSKRNTSEKRPRSINPQGSTEKSLSVPQDLQDRSLKIIKVEAEEMEMWGDEPDEEETTTYICPDETKSTSERHPRLDCTQESTEDIHGVPEDPQDESVRRIKVEAEEVEVWGEEQHKVKKRANNHPVCIEFSKMVCRSKVTETLRQQVVQMKGKGVTLSAIAREVGRSKSVISRILHLYNITNSFKSPKKAGRPRKTNAREDWIMQRLSISNPFNTAAGIARQFSTDQGKDLSRHTAARRLRAFGLEADSAVTKPH